MDVAATELAVAVVDQKVFYEKMEAVAVLAVAVLAVAGAELLVSVLDVAALAVVVAV